jgi:2'-5' RNA ligase
MNTNLPASPESGSFALVTYIPEPLGLFLKELRKRLPGHEDPQAHITLLPPRRLKYGLDAVSQTARRVLNQFEPFDIALSAVKAFPQTDVLYLEIADGSQTIHAMHAALNTGILADREPFEFLPHLTLSGPIGAKDVTGKLVLADRIWQEYQGERRFSVVDVVALWQPVDGSWNDWTRVWTQKLGDSRHSATVGT